MSALLATGATAADQPAYRWQNVAIGGGGFVTGLQWHPRERGLAYARTDVGGAYRWDAVQGRWIPLLDWLPAADDNFMGIESLALDPSDPARLYLAAGTYTNARVGNGAILRSDDRGAHFERSDLPFKLGGNEIARGNGERLAVDPNDGRVLLLGTRSDGLWRSDDRGAHWRKAENFPALATSAAASAPSWKGDAPIGIVAIAFDPASGKPGAPTPRVYAAVSSASEPGLQVSDDAGASWHVVAGQPRGLRIARMARASDGHWYFACADRPGPELMGNGVLWKYSPATGTWTDVTPVAQSSDRDGDGFGWGAVAVDPADPQVVVASTFNRFSPHDEIYRSRDGGAHWTSLLEGARFERDNAPWTATSKPHWISDLAIDPSNADEVMFTTGYGVWASRNLRAADRGAAVTWWFKDTGLEETVPLDLLSPSRGAPLLSALGDIDGFRHEKLDVATEQFAGPRLTNGQSIASAGQAPQIVVRSGTLRHREGNAVRAAYSRDGGSHWTAFASEPPEGEGAGQMTISADGSRTIWWPKNGGAWLSDDFGGRWQRVRGLPAMAVVEADRVDAGVFYAFDGSAGQLYVSGNGGVDFKPAQAALKGEADGFRPQLRADPLHAGVLYIGAASQGVLRWAEKGLERLPGIDHVGALGLGAGKPGSDRPALYAYGRVGGQEGLYRSDDDGRRWLRIDDSAHRFGRIRLIEGDGQVHGRVYLAVSGRGVIYGEPQ